MRKMIVICDRCGKEVQGQIGFICMGTHELEDESRTAMRTEDDRDYCQTCMDDIYKCIMGGDSTAEEPEADADQAEEEPHIDEKQVQEYREIAGKSRQLEALKMHDSGQYTNKQLAEHFGVSVQSIRNWLRPHLEGRS